MLVIIYEYIQIPRYSTPYDSFPSHFEEFKTKKKPKNQKTKKPKKPENTNSILPVKGKGGEGLLDRHDFQGVDVNVLWQGGDPVNYVCNVLSRKGGRVLVRNLGPLSIPLEPHQAELRLSTPGFQAAYPNLASQQIRPQVQAELPNKRFFSEGNTNRQG